MRNISFKPRFFPFVNGKRKTISLFNFMPMKKSAIILYSLLFLFACQGIKKEKALAATQAKPQDILCEAADSATLQSLLKQFSGEKGTAMGMLVTKLGKAFLGVPYVSHTLEHGKEEPLTVESDALDCTTFAETALALARTIKSPEADLNRFARELENIRYRDGERDGYLSRLHYFSDWIRNNRQKGIVGEPAQKFGGPLDVQVDFMSTHPESYAVLKENPELVPEIAKQEKEVSAREYFFVPKEAIENKEQFLREGDIVGLATSIKGLDVAHVGILVEVEGRIHLLHASTQTNRVVISEEPLADMLQSKKIYTGIMIARPVDY
jgi:hypothetical protein